MTVAQISGTNSFKYLEIVPALDSSLEFQNVFKLSHAVYTIETFSICAGFEIHSKTLVSIPPTFAMKIAVSERYFNLKVFFDVISFTSPSTK